MRIKLFQIITVFVLFSGIYIPHANSLDLRYEPIQPLAPPLNLNKKQVELGEKLFHDLRLSSDNDMSCATCHVLGDNGADHLSHSPGRDNTFLTVNTPTVFNSSLNHRQFWDGRAWTLEEQIDFVLSNTMEFNNNWPVVIKRIKKDKLYQTDFANTYSDGISAKNIRHAVATFERSLITTNSRFDQYLLGDEQALNLQEKEGYRVFKSYGCVACHQGQNVGGNMFMKFGVFGDYFKNRKETTNADLGRFNVTGDENDRYVFRVPSLRLVAITAPYFHDGSVASLSEAVKIMAKHQLGRTIPEEHVLNIVAFLKTLTGDYNGRPLTPYTEQKAP